MPCTPDAVCDGLTNPDQNNTINPNLVPSSSVHFANMGWVGYVFFRSNKLDANNILRVTSADINLSQEITMPDVIDGRIDRTVYQLGPKIVEGTLSLPVVADVDIATYGNCPAAPDLQAAGSLLNSLWCWATARGNHGRLLFDDGVLDIRYANHSAFTFDSAVVNTYSMSVAQSEAVTLDLNILGRARKPSNDVVSEPAIADFLAPARVLTWNDVTVNGIGGCGAWENVNLFHSVQVREFNMEINNNADRFYTLNGSLFPMDVNVGKREITGSITLMGLQDQLRRLAEENQEHFTEKNEIRVAFYIGEPTETVIPGGVTFVPRDWLGLSNTTPPANSIWARRLTGVVFRIEEMSMTNDLYETTVNFNALASDSEGYEAIAPGTSCSATAGGSFPAWQ